jgi:hypothetical protein
MGHFYGTVRGNRGEATRVGSKDSGVETYCASWAGAIRVHAYEQDGEDWVRVSMVKWKGSGEERLIYEGPIGKFEPENSPLREVVLAERL